MTISRAVSRTMPSVGMSSVGAVKNAASSALSRAPEAAGRETSIARSRVEKRLVTSTYGAGSPAAHSA
ncbi:hypothetical protein D3C83_251420 [compost metagenome]